MGKRNKVVKLTDKKVKYIIRAKTRNDSTKNIALDMKLSESTVKRVWMYWSKHHEPILIKEFGRKKKEIDEKSELLILEIHKEQQLGARRLEKVIKFKSGMQLSHNKIHQILLKHGLAKENENKKKRRKAWIRYERKHSLTAVHLDWHPGKVVKKDVCVVLDDSSRYILAGGEFDAATAENSINLVQEVLDNYSWIRKIEQVITDRGSQFYANKKDKNDVGESSFESFLYEHEIRHIKARIKHPQTNGKVEKWYDLYEKQRSRFDSFTDFVKWYNTIRFHESLDARHYLQTPEDAFWSRLPTGCKLNVFLNRMEAEIV
ncbi:MAG TPA: transposase family protein [Candidatus Methanoperedenaceae archaeon]|nr:transposase family protein [Candidatus Methanoperedenaceae archaeon]